MLLRALLILYLVFVDIIELKLVEGRWSKIITDVKLGLFLQLNEHFGYVIFS